MSNRTVQPLSKFQAGQKGIVVAFNGGRSFRNRIMSMGLKVGSELQVVSTSQILGGPVLVMVGETRLAIGWGMAQKIMIKLIK